MSLDSILIQDARDRVIIGSPASARNSYFSFKEGGDHFLTPYYDLPISHH
jgi:hypothetical protein